ncbi:hypothetical protein SNOG_14246 [Parastagonospora nodorum SN15]|uniref:Uncharacterized protein n=1 Tax=Phaeosphaeria nodorum (strain SN15 / ATCC MYA-4574 / FGSC 10173) TaxID=321614 RepID=Q0U282_PHANO|nr:hypothetical protein SNOG_14246 [Parastagonospora nodorum SN15]EAT78483.1 hypothetical protein SNOG_14246 [Parastagonospora nodorum SN15]
MTTFTERASRQFSNLVQSCPNSACVNPSYTRTLPFASRSHFAAQLTTRLPAMSLLDLPTEIIHGVCKVLGLRDYGNGNMYFLNDDLRSLRLTCRTMYNRTMYDAGIHYAGQLKIFSILPTEMDIRDLLSVSRIPEFRDSIAGLDISGPGSFSSQIRHNSTVWATVQLAVATGVSLERALYPEKDVSTRTHAGPRQSRRQRSLSALSGIDHLVLYGCNDILQGPVLRLCTGCNDIFTNYFAGATYNQLNGLRIASMYISGSWLRLFIKNHANTLPQVELERMVLTDGTWRSIARGLAKLRHLSALFSCGQLYQKQSATLVIRMPAGVSVHPSISLNGHAQTQQFLLAWLEHFHTDPCPPSTWDRALLPQYHEVCFSKPNDLYMDRDKSTWRKRTTPLVNPYKTSAK